MARLVYAESFLEDMARVELAAMREEILAKADLLEAFPDLGSKNTPRSIRERYGPAVRKLVVQPFDVVYEHDSQAGAVYILGLVHHRAAY